MVSFPVTFKDGHYERVKFVPFSHGGSMFTTDNVALQEAIEALPTFGKQIKLEYTEPAPELKKEEVEEVKELIQVEVNDLDEAKDYLCDNFKVNRAYLRSKTSIAKAALEKGILFVGI